ncbi:DUF4261 domain-containing protein [Mediterraneibacter glycyrrhizinilyticus]|nr:DUF4261 domain-containing protein [Mediterraneibacter glycyrrhizinilyticus]
MDIADLSDNIISRRWKERCANLPDDKRKKLETFEHSDYQLQVIKRKRIYPQPGDIFQINPREDIYFYGIYSSGTVFEPQFYEGCAQMMKKNGLPILNWIWFGLWQREGGICCYTYGMSAFGKDEMEVLDADAKPSDVRDFLLNLVDYVLENDIVLNDGETIGFSAEDKHAITRSKGAALPGMTLKIEY